MLAGHTNGFLWRIRYDVCVYTLTTHFEVTLVNTLDRKPGHLIKWFATYLAIGHVINKCFRDCWSLVGKLLYPNSNTSQNLNRIKKVKMVLKIGTRAKDIFIRFFNT